MPLNQLTRKEKLVFYSIVKHPDFNDNQVSKEIDVKRSTVTAIRNRLRKEGFYSRMVVPNFPGLGCRLLQITYGKYNPAKPYEERVKTEAFGEGIKHPELVMARSTDTEFLKIYVAENLYDIRVVQDKSFIEYESHDFIENIHSIHYPFELCSISSLFNYVPLMGSLLGMEVEEKDYNNYIFNGHKKEDLTNVEKVVLDGLVANPEASTVELAKITGKTRSTVSKVTQELAERRMIQNICLPTLEKMGCELMVFLHTKFNPKSSMETRKEDMKYIMKEASHVFKVSGDIESSGIIVLKNYTEYIALYNKMIGLYREKKYITDNPRALLFPIAKIKSKKMDFSALTHKMLFERD